MEGSDIGKSCRIVMKDGHPKTGVVIARTDKSITIRLANGDAEELFLDAVASIKINNGWLNDRR